MDIQNAVPAVGFAIPPYSAKQISSDGKWSGVFNAMGLNCLTFKHKPGAVVCDFETAMKIADSWNGVQSNG